MIEKYKISNIIVDTSINTLPQLDQTIIEEYQEAITEYGIDNWTGEWLEMPKITADKYLWSGFHTIEAAIRAFGKDQEVYFEVEGKNRNDALLLATGENGKRGRRRSNKEKQIAVLRWLHDKKGREWTNNYIATQCNVSDSFVRSIVENLTSNKRSEIYDENYQRPTQLKYINKHGQKATMETKDIGKNDALDAEIRQSCIDQFVERLLLSSRIPWHTITNHESEIGTSVYTEETIQELLFVSKIQSRYNMTDTDVENFLKDVEKSVLDTINKDRKRLIERVDALYQKALENEFGHCNNYTELVKSIQYYKDNEAIQTEMLAVLCQAEVTDPHMKSEGFDVTHFDNWISLLTRYHRGFEDMFSPNPEGCKWDLHLTLENGGELTKDTVDLQALADTYNLTVDTVRALVSEVIAEAHDNDIDTMCEYLNKIKATLLWINNKLTHIKETDDQDRIREAATCITTYADISEIVSELVKDAQILVDEHETNC